MTSRHQWTINVMKQLSEDCFWATVCKTVRPMLSDRCLSCLSVLSVCDIGVSWPNGWTDQDETWHAGIGLGPGHIVLDGDPAHPPQKGAQSPPIFGPYLLWSNGWMDQDATWYGSRPQPRPHCVRRGPSSPPPRKGHSSRPLFGPRLLWPRSPISATAELLFIML